MILRCGTVSAQSTAAARELFEERYRSSTPRQVATGLIKGVSLCTNCGGAPQWPTDFGDPLVGGPPLAKIKGEPFVAGFPARRSADEFRAFGADDIVDMAAHILQLYSMCYVCPAGPWPLSSSDIPIRHATPLRPKGGRGTTVQGEKGDEYRETHTRSWLV